MTTINHKQLLREAQEADYKLASFIVTCWSWIAILGIALLCVEVLL